MEQLKQLEISCGAIIKKLHTIEGNKITLYHLIKSLPTQTDTQYENLCALFDKFYGWEHTCEEKTKPNGEIRYLFSKSISN